MSQKYLYLPRVRLYSDNQRDREILDWLRGLQSGFKGDSIKNAIWASIKGIEPPPNEPAQFVKSPPQAPSYSYEASSVKNGTMRASFTFDTHELLADIRRIVDAALQQALGTLEVSQKESITEIEGDKIEDILDTLQMNFMLDDDDDDDEEEL